LQMAKTVDCRNIITFNPYQVRKLGADDLNRVNRNNCFLNYSKKNCQFWSEASNRRSRGDAFHCSLSFMIIVWKALKSHLNLFWDVFVSIYREVLIFNIHM
jgi:hypothetical protein